MGNPPSRDLSHFNSFYTDRFLNNGDELVLTCSGVLTLLTHKMRTTQVHEVGSTCAVCTISRIILVDKKRQTLIYILIPKVKD
jgi:hypothetical protein